MTSKTDISTAFHFQQIFQLTNVSSAHYENWVWILLVSELHNFLSCTNQQG